jgi:hypothetical protein
MLFLNKQEEVLDIQLTPYGKHLLSRGKFKPVYYAFFDDNILYDSEYAGFEEDQNEIQARIKDSTPQLQAQYKFTGKFEKTIEVDFGTGDKLVPTIPSMRTSLTSDLGNSKPLENKYPAINLRFLKGEANSYDLSYRTKFGDKIIPQINLTLEYLIYINAISLDSTAEIGTPMDSHDADVYFEDQLLDSSFSSPIAQDGTFLSIVNDYILADIVEENTDFKMENFNIEVFKVVTNPPEEEELISLSFAKNIQEKIVNNILLDSPDEDADLELVLCPDNVEYYFDIFYDHDIDRELISNSVSLLRSEGFYTDEDFVSEDNPFVRLANSDIYGTNVTPDDIEDCEGE